MSEQTDQDLYELARRVGEGLQRRQLSIATAESCTAGLVAAALTAVPGSSAWFERGFVTYSNIAKQEMLGVTGETLSSHGAVSEATVREMAEGALHHSHAQTALAVSGIAGPGGGLPGKPVGTVCFAWAAPGLPGRYACEFFSGGDRETVRRQAVARALEGVLELLDAWDLPRGD